MLSAQACAQVSIAHDADSVAITAKTMRDWADKPHPTQGSIEGVI